MPTMMGVYLRIIVFLSVLFSPITYLVYGHPESMMAHSHIAGCLFWFGTIPPVYLFGGHLSPLWSQPGGSFEKLVAMWAVTGIYLVVNSPPWLGKRVTIGGHAICIALQTLSPFILFPGYDLVIPFPIPAIVALCSLLVYMINDDRPQKESQENKIESDLVPRPGFEPGSRNRKSLMLGRTTLPGLTRGNNV